MKRSCELVLKQPDGKVKRLVMERDCSDVSGGNFEDVDSRMVRMLCDSMMDSEFRAALSDVDLASIS